ncbi:hypothetical protein VP424E501_P0121 [Vibrio phage 424E50-1]|nr:hypothetical protein VP424E501_P0121 [Vibrio phage 424E50-1]CAH9013745.1 hypothetical protein VP501E541_P0121 [Vibrio phage 501E54-1]
MSYPKPEGVVYQVEKKLVDGEIKLKYYEESRFTEGSTLQKLHAAQNRREELIKMYGETEWKWFTAEVED